MPYRNLIKTAQAIHAELVNQVGPPEDGIVSHAQLVIFTPIVRNTREYIMRVANQINGSYENGWYDACAVMLRRLIETLIIEAFESHNISNKIKNSSGDFLYLKDLIDKTLSEPSWNLGRNTKKSLPKLKDIGDKSAHSRRYIAQRGDIQPLLDDIRTVVQELIYIAKFK